jgi:3-polyprenyl-4-hydroxybenzoate decarboxylase
MQTGLIPKLGIDATRPLERPSEKFEQAKRPVNKKIATIIEEMRKSL